MIAEGRSSGLFNPLYYFIKILKLILTAGKGCNLQGMVKMLLIIIYSLQVIAEMQLSSRVQV